TPLNGMQFSTDHRYLAVAASNSRVVVYDLQTKQEIGRCSNDSWIPCFLSGTHTFLAFGEPEKNHAIRYDITDQGLEANASFDKNYLEDAFLCFNGSCVVTMHKISPWWNELSGWFPDKV